MTLNSNLQNHTHKRFNALTGEWVLVSPHRAKRPWQGQEEETSVNNRPTYDENCYLCAGNTRANGEINPNYKDVFVFTNDYSALKNDSEAFSIDDGLFQAKSEEGICKVICFSPDHSKSLAQINISEIEKVITVWQKEYLELGANPKINYVQIFENKGAIMGCSNPHPHGQIWSQSTLPNEVVKKNQQQLNYFEANNKSLLNSYLKQEITHKERIVFKNNHFAVLVPFWAIWPFETMIIPINQQQHIAQIPEDEVQSFAEAISMTTRIYDAVFNCSFPYSSGIHQAPTNNKDHKHWHWHMSFYPPLLRSASVKKFMVGYEMFGSPQRDITAEKAAELLRKLASQLN